MLNGKCTNANLITKLVNFCVKKQIVLFKGKRMNLSQIGAFKDGYCTCCEEVIVTPGGSSSSSSGGAGIGGDLVESWANAKFFNTQSNNQFFCGGTFGQLKILTQAGNLYFEVSMNDFTNLQSGLITFYDASNIILGSASIGFSTNYQGVINSNIAQNNVVRAVISAGTYSTPNNSLCTSGSITFTP